VNVGGHRHPGVFHFGSRLMNAAIPGTVNAMTPFRRVDQTLCDQIRADRAETGWSFMVSLVLC
jgi:hypothetical protein